MDKTTTYIQEKIRKLEAINPIQEMFQCLRDCEINILKEILRLHQEDIKNVKTN